MKRSALPDRECLKIVDLIPGAQELARRILLTDCITAPGNATQGLVYDLIGHGGPRHISEEEWPLQSEALDAAYAIGIAVGLLLRPELFAKGGAR